MPGHPLRRVLLAPPRPSRLSPAPGTAENQQADQDHDDDLHEEPDTVNDPLGREEAVTEIETAVDSDGHPDAARPHPARSADEAQGHGSDRVEGHFNGSPSRALGEDVERTEAHRCEHQYDRW